MRLELPALPLIWLCEVLAGFRWPHHVACRPLVAMPSPPAYRRSEAGDRLRLQLHRADAVIAQDAGQRRGGRHRGRVADAWLRRRGHQMVVNT